MSLHWGLNLACLACNLMVSLYIFWRYSGQRLHRLLAIQISGVVGYNILVSALAHAGSYGAAAAWIRYGMVLPYGMVFSFYWFCVVFGRAEGFPWARRLGLTLLVPAGLDIVGRIVGWFPSPQINFRPGQGWFPGLDLPYMALYVPTLFLLSVSGLGIIVRRIRVTRSLLERQHLLIMLGALGSGFLLSLSGIFPQTSVLMPLSPLAYTAVVTWGLSRRRLLSLNLLVREGALAAVGSFLLTAGVAFLILVGVRAVGGAGHSASNLLCAALLFAGLYPFLFDWTRALLGRWLGREVSTSQRLLEYSLLATASSSFNGLVQATLQRLVQDHGLRRACLVLPDRGGKLEAFASYPAQDPPPATLSSSGAVAEALLSEPAGLDADSLGWTRQYEREPADVRDEEEVREYLERSRFQACFPMIVRGRLRGVLLVGAPASERGLLAHEMDFFAALAAQMAGMIETAFLEGQIQHADRLSTLGMLAASVAHEIRNPLASMSVFVQMMSQRHADPKFLEKFNRLVPGEIEKLSRLTDELLNLARPATRAHLVVDLGLLCQNQRQLVSHQFQKGQVRLSLAAPEGILVQGVESELSQVFLNLVLNALDMSPAGAEVRVELRRGELGAELSVIDAGPGISPALKPRLFEPFFTTKANGNGLGLATSRRIVESFGGSLSAENHPDAGAVFTVRLPLAQLNSQAAA